MDTRLLRTGMLATLLLVMMASVAFAGPINCGLTPGNSACAPTLTVTYASSGQSPTTLRLVGTTTVNNGNWLVSFTPQTLSTFSFGGQAVTNPDPFVGFSTGFINSSPGNMTFTYDFTTPFSGGPYEMAQTIGVDSLLDTAFTGTSAITPVGGGGFAMNSYVNGVLIPGFGRVDGCTTGAGFFCQSGFVGLLGPVPYLSAASGTLEITGSFTLTPNSQYTLTGRTDLLQPVPEPGTLVMLGSGILGLAGMMRRKLTE